MCRHSWWFSYPWEARHLRSRKPSETRDDPLRRPGPSSLFRSPCYKSVPTFSAQQGCYFLDTKKKLDSWIINVESADFSTDMSTLSSLLFEVHWYSCGVDQKNQATAALLGLRHDPRLLAVCRTDTLTVNTQGGGGVGGSYAGKNPHVWHDDSLLVILSSFPDMLLNLRDEVTSDVP